ncbi:PorT family protein [Pontibacter sp. SD6]|uniref:PorT family protein n=2 Tax=Pontibacter cellulosilyticus TaxID=1720253 RepID=A0A923NAS7_9BACT|nr:PorT family protein [Pontibacter cellulosilyticus]
MSKINGISTTKGSYDWLKQFHGGIVLAHKIGDKLYLQPELIYSQKGYSFEIARNNKGVFGDTILYHEKNKINYLDLPILAKVGTKGLYFEAGPQFSFLLDGKRTETRTTSTNGSTQEHEHARDLFSVVEKVDIGFAGGFGYQTETGLGLGFRFNQSFKEVIDQENWKKNIALQLSAFYLLGKKKEIRNILPPPPPVIAAPDVEYYDKRKASKKGYSIVSSMNMGRVTFSKVADSEQTHVEYKIISTSGFAPQDVMIAGSSGTIQDTGIVKGYRDVVYPFQGSIQFSIPATMGTSAPAQSRMEYEIKEPGHWRITITISR